ncbi:MAG: hypothetical protein ACJAZS_000366 [Alteromonas naphthalenivorans]|jgi:hypothetical protein
MKNFILSTLLFFSFTGAAANDKPVFAAYHPSEWAKCDKNSLLRYVLYIMNESFLNEKTAIFKVNKILKKEHSNIFERNMLAQMIQKNNEEVIRIICKDPQTCTLKNPFYIVTLKLGQLTVYFVVIGAESAQEAIETVKDGN